MSNITKKLYISWPSCKSTPWKGIEGDQRHPELADSASPRFRLLPRLRECKMYCQWCNMKHSVSNEGQVTSFTSWNAISVQYGTQPHVSAEGECCMYKKASTQNTVLRLECF